MNILDFRFWILDSRRVEAGCNFAGIFPAIENPKSKIQDGGVR
jgi:hypothetical protein